MVFDSYSVFEVCHLDLARAYAVAGLLPFRNDGALRSGQNTEYSRSSKTNHPVIVAVVALVVMVAPTQMILNQMHPTT